MKTALTILVIVAVIYVAVRIYRGAFTTNGEGSDTFSAHYDTNKKRTIELSSWFIESPGRRQQIFASYLNKTDGDKLAAYELAYSDYLKDLDRGR